MAVIQIIALNTIVYKLPARLLATNHPPRSTWPSKYMAE